MVKSDATAEREVTCIRTQPHRDRHKGITHLGGTGWLMTRWQMTASIESGGGVYYVRVNGTRANIQVAAGDGEPYLRAVADNQWTDALLALPECRREH
jgi:hypothetical protein